MILVTGATGHVGSELLIQLAARGEKVRAMTRRPQTARFPSGVEVAGGDFDDAPSLDLALEGVEQVFLVTTQPAGSAGGPTHERLVVSAARRAAVRRIVKLSVLGGARDRNAGDEADRDPITRWHRAAEGAVMESGISWTMLRPGRFMSNALQWASMIRQGGKVQVPFATRPAASIDPADIASVALRALTEPGHDGKSYELSGPAALTPEQEIRILGGALDRPLELVALPRDAACAGMRRAGMPDDVIDAILARAITDHGTEVLSTVQDVTGRPPRTFEQWVSAHVDAFR